MSLKVINETLKLNLNLTGNHFSDAQHFAYMLSKALLLHSALVVNRRENSGLYTRRVVLTILDKSMDHPFNVGKVLK